MLDFYGSETILVVDPQTRKLSIPLAAVLPTQALNRPDRVPSICMLFLCGRCRQGTNCHQLHADPVIVEQLRSDASQRMSCCPEHGEEVSTPTLHEVAPAITKINLEGFLFAAGRVATTNGIRRAVTDCYDAAGTPDTLTITRSQVCRLHVQGRCRYAEDCNFIHLCRPYTSAPENAELNAMLNAATPKQLTRAGFYRSTPGQQYSPMMVPPSPLYSGMPATPVFGNDSMMPLDAQEDSAETTPPSTPALNDSIRRTPVGVAWRHEPYSWQCVSPVRAH